METDIDIPRVAPPLPSNNADLPLMLPSSTPRFEGFSLVSALHPLLIILALLYCFPGLFSDHTAQALVETCRLDVYIESEL